MLTPVAFFVFALSPSAPSLGAAALPPLPPPPPQEFSLRAPDLAQRGARTARRWLAQNDIPAGDLRPARDEGGACEFSCAACRESDQQARDVLRRRRSAISLHRAFGLATWGSMLVTQVFGTIASLNEDALFGQGPCASGRPDDAVFGRYGCSGLRGVHLTLTFLTTGLYATAGVLAQTAPDPERVSEGTDTHARRLRVHRALTWVHATGMVLLPILGVLASNPEVLLGAGVDGASSRAEFSRAMRSVEQVVGYTTFGAYTVAAVYGLL